MKVTVRGRRTRSSWNNKHVSKVVYATLSEGFRVLSDHSVYCSVVITHAGIAAGVGRAFSHVCLFVCLSVCPFVRALTGKRLELSTPNFVRVYSIAVASRSACNRTQRSKRSRSRSHGYKNSHVDVDVDGVYERRPKPLCPHLEITSR